MAAESGRCAKKGQKRQRPPLGGGCGGRRFGGRPWEEEKVDLFVIAGEEVGSNEIHFVVLYRRDEAFEGNNARRWEEDAAGAVSVANLWEEVKVGLFVVAGEEVGSDEIPWLDRLARYRLDLVTIDAEIGELPIGKPTQLGNRLTISSPVAVAADQVHFLFSSNCVGRCRPEDSDRLARDEMDVAAADAEVVQFTVAQAAQLGNGFTVAAPVAVVADQVHDISRFVFSSDHSVSVYGREIGAFVPI